MNERQVDVFLDVFEMCHKIDLSERLRIPGETIPLADLLLCKLQVIETNEKELRDVLALLVDHDFSEDDSGINVTYLSDLAARDWGLWRTTTMIAERTDKFARGLEGFGGQDRIHTQVWAYLDALGAVPKSRAWRLRARVGDRVRWYEEPDESR
jgi:hypothetical protein